MCLGTSTLFWKIYRPGLVAVGELGNGKKFSSAWPLLFIRLAGIRFPANWLPVLSEIVAAIGLPFLSTPEIDLEKSPIRSKAVGTVTVTGSVGVIVWGLSIETKKKALFLVNEGPPSPKRGSGNGPPKLKPGILWRYCARPSPCLLVKKLLPFSDSLRTK